MKMEAGRAPGPEADGVGTSALRLDPDAFARLYQESYRALWCIAAGTLGDRDRAADIVQEAAMIALRKAGDFRPGTSFLAWMGRIVRFTAINERRKGHRQRTVAAEPDTLDRQNPALDRPDPGPSGVVDDHGRLRPDSGQFDDAVLQALDRLADQARSCLLLRTVVGLSYRDISLALDIPEGTAMSHVHRARRALRAMLAGHPRVPESGGEGGAHP